ncbi:MAG TPA: flagellar biosynthetic protein FliR [Terriglobales bacterium]|nr:flagellar biosynthetic protein FliR [Terriglobales bacterium]
MVPALLIATRLSGVLIVAPFFGADSIPPRVKAALVIALTAVLLPASASALPHATILAWFGDGLSELVIGLLLGLTVKIVFEAVQLAGDVAGFQFGLSLESSIDPTSEASSTVLATLHQLLVLYIFLQVGVQRWVLLGLASSFVALPLGSSLAALTPAQLLNFAGNLFVWGLELAMPVLVVTLLIDVALAFFAKVAPQLPVIFVGMPVKALVGYGVLMAAFHFWPGILTHHFNDALAFFLQHTHPIT